MNEIIKRQKNYFLSGATKDIDFRISKLNNLKTSVLKRETEIINALQKDLGKPALESYTTEISMLTEEIKFITKHLRSWAKIKRVKTPFTFFSAKSRICPEPFGITLIIGTWNYPIQLSLSPLVGSIAAGNCAIIKPSEVSPHSSKIVADIIRDSFSEEHAAVIEGDGTVASNLLKEKFDYIFYTGSVTIGKIIMEAASKNLTPVTLELGGKNPCIVDKNVDIEIAARRIVWGKFINTGQTCIAPDYLVVHEDIKDKLLAGIKKYIKEFYSETPQDCVDYGRIVNEKHFNRLVKFFNEGKIIIGGEADEKKLYIAPTVIDNIDWNDPIMQEEIFGPILPVMTYKNLTDVIDKINGHPKPLALYFFSNEKKLQDKIVSETSSGGVCINATIFHQININLPFGGVGDSGMGAYHGKASFDTFSHYKSVLKKSYWPDIKAVYPPYKNKLIFVKKIWG